MCNYFMKTGRIGFLKWTLRDLELAKLLWSDPDVTRFICATGNFSEKDIADRLNLEIQNDALHQVQYWPIFEITARELIGCCGLRPWKGETNVFEMGVHLRKKFWGKGFASEAAQAVVDYAFSTLHVSEIRAGHHPQNAASRKLLFKLGFQYVEDSFYEPTGLYHPSYCLKAKG